MTLCVRVRFGFTPLIEVRADFHREAAEMARKEMRNPSRWAKLVPVVDVADESEEAVPIDFSKD